MIKREVATQIISEVVVAVKRWRSLALKLGISNREMELFGQIFDERSGVLYP
jgi:serine/threonine-protein kinase HipA